MCLSCIYHKLDMKNVQSSFCYAMSSFESDYCYIQTHTYIMFISETNKRYKDHRSTYPFTLMDIYRLKEDITFAQQIGATLDTAESTKRNPHSFFYRNVLRLKLELGLLRLTELANADQLLFWGRIDTTSKPYYIAVGVDYKGHYQFCHKKFYYSTNSFVFALLPDLLLEYNNKIGSFNHLPLTGNPKHILVNVVGEGGQGGNEPKKDPPADVDSDEETVVKVELRNLTELDRLSYIVRAVENDCQLVPIGAFRLNELHELRINDSFPGLSKKDATQLKSYHHFRAPQTKQKKEKISSADSIFAFDLFDPIDRQPQWSLQTDVSGRMVTVRNLYWPGYVGYHRCESTTYGGVYMGDGIKRIDLPFYL